MTTQFIPSEGVRTTLQVLVALKKCDDNNLDWTLPAALSTNDPKRNVQGAWTTPAGKQVGQLLQQIATQRRLHHS